MNHNQNTNHSLHYLYVRDVSAYVVRIDYYYIYANYYEIGVFTFSMLYYSGEQGEVEMGKMGISIVYYTYPNGCKTNIQQQYIPL